MQYVKVAYIGLNNLYSRATSLLLKQSPVVERLNIYGDKKYTGYEDFKNIPSDCQILTFGGQDQIYEALEGVDIILIGDELIKSTDKTEHEVTAMKLCEYAKAIAQTSPDAFLVVAASPVNVFLPFMAQLYDQMGCLNANKLIGTTTADIIRANSLYATHMRMDPMSVVLPVVGGCSPMTRVPLFSHAFPKCLLPTETRTEITYQIKHNEDLNAENQAACTIDKAYATVRLIHSIAAGLNGPSTVPEIALVKNYTPLDAEYFALPLLIGRKGVEKVFSLKDISDEEKNMIQTAVEHMNLETDKAKYLVNMNQKESNQDEEHSNEEKLVAEKQGYILMNDIFSPGKDTINLNNTKQQQQPTLPIPLHCPAEPYIETPSTNLNKDIRQVKRKAFGSQLAPHYGKKKIGDFLDTTDLGTNKLIKQEEPPDFQENQSIQLNENKNIKKDKPILDDLQTEFIINNEADIERIKNNLRRSLEVIKAYNKLQRNKKTNDNATNFDKELINVDNIEQLIENNSPKQPLNSVVVADSVDNTKEENIQNETEKELSNIEYGVVIANGETKPITTQDHRKIDLYEHNLAKIEKIFHKSRSSVDDGSKKEEKLQPKLKSNQFIERNPQEFIESKHVAQNIKQNSGEEEFNLKFTETSNYTELNGNNTMDLLNNSTKKIVPKNLEEITNKDAQDFEYKILFENKLNNKENHPVDAEFDTNLFKLNRAEKYDGILNIVHQSKPSLDDKSNRLIKERKMEHNPKENLIKSQQYNSKNNLSLKNLTISKKVQPSLSKAEEYNKTQSNSLQNRINKLENQMKMVHKITEKLKNNAVKSSEQQQQQHLKAAEFYVDKNITKQKASTVHNKDIRNRQAQINDKTVSQEVKQDMKNDKKETFNEQNKVEVYTYSIFPEVQHNVSYNIANNNKERELKKDLGMKELSLPNSHPSLKKINKNKQINPTKEIKNTEMKKVKLSETQKAKLYSKSNSTVLKNFTETAVNENSKIVDGNILSAKVNNEEKKPVSTSGVIDNMKKVTDKRQRQIASVAVNRSVQTRGEESKQQPMETLENIVPISSLKVLNDQISQLIESKYNDVLAENQKSTHITNADRNSSNQRISTIKINKTTTVNNEIQTNKETNCDRNDQIDINTNSVGCQTNNKKPESGKYVQGNLKESKQQQVRKFKEAINNEELKKIIDKRKFANKLNTNEKEINKFERMEKDRKLKTKKLIQPSKVRQQNFDSSNVKVANDKNESEKIKSKHFNWVSDKTTDKKINNENVQLKTNNFMSKMNKKEIESLKTIASKENKKVDITVKNVDDTNFSNIKQSSQSDMKSTQLKNSLSEDNIKKIFSKKNESKKLKETDDYSEILNKPQKETSYQYEVKKDVVMLNSNALPGTTQPIKKPLKIEKSTINQEMKNNTFKAKINNVNTNSKSRHHEILDNELKEINKSKQYGNNLLKSRTYDTGYNQVDGEKYYGEAVKVRKTSTSSIRPIKSMKSTIDNDENIRNTEYDSQLVSNKSRKFTTIRPIYRKAVKVNTSSKESDKPTAKKEFRMKMQQKNDELVKISANKGKTPDTKYKIWNPPEDKQLDDNKTWGGRLFQLFKNAIAGDLQDEQTRNKITMNSMKLKDKLPPVNDLRTKLYVGRKIQTNWKSNLNVAQKSINRYDVSNQFTPNDTNVHIRGENKYKSDRRNVKINAPKSISKTLTNKNIIDQKPKSKKDVMAYFGRKVTSINNNLKAEEIDNFNSGMDIRPFGKFVNMRVRSRFN